jgi:5-methylcytosine-specific restriction endonuclease McrA
MTYYSEPELWLPALRALAESPGGLTTSQLIADLTARMRPSGPDLAPHRNRRDSRFSQQVRNLLGSHKRLVDLGYVTSSGARGSFAITPDGRRYLSEAEPTEAALLAEGHSRTAITRERRRSYRDVIVEEGTEVSRTVRQRRRSRLLRGRAIAALRARTGRLACEACAFDFEATYGPLGRDYIEMHHRVPLHTTDATKTGIRAAIRGGRLIALCANCHRMIHRLPGPVPSLAGLRAALAATP